MKQNSLQHAFNSYFHNKYLFQDFISLNISLEYQDVFHSKHTFSPSKKLKKYQQFLNLFIFDFMPINKDVLFSYRKGVNSYDAIYPHKDSRYIFSTDIKSFFLQITKKDIKNLILENSDKYLINKEDILKYIDNIVELVSYQDILPIGAPTSPKISNTFLFKLDNSLQKYCHIKNIIYTRYSDDFIFSSDNYDDIKHLDTIIKQKLIDLDLTKLEINKQKTKIQKRGFKITLLGLNIIHGGHITVDKYMKEEIEILFYFYINDKVKFKHYLERVYESNLDKVSGKLNYIKSVDKKFISKLKRKYGNYIVNSFIHREIDE